MKKKRKQGVFLPRIHVTSIQRFEKEKCNVRHITLTGQKRDNEIQEGCASITAWKSVLRQTYEIQHIL